MLNLLRRGATGFETLSPAAGWVVPDDALWLDLVSPSREEELAVEAALGLELPTLEEMAQLEPSSRLYQEAGATFMTATLLSRSDEGPRGTPVTFVLTKGLLVDLRYEELRAFKAFADRAPAQAIGSGSAALLGLLDAVIERLAEILEQTGAAVEVASTEIFRGAANKKYDALLADLARAQSVTSTTRTSLVSLARLLSFGALAPEIASDPGCKAHLKSLQRDAQSLTEHTTAQSSHIAFLLDAALGLINIEQNAIIKFFSVVAVVFMPPTLVASIFGMNFKHMPELDWPLGYPFALAVMLATAVLPVLWFKRRGWF